MSPNGIGYGCLLVDTLPQAAPTCGVACMMMVMVMIFATMHCRDAVMQDGLWSPPERHPDPGRKSVLVHTMTLPLAAVEPLVSALKRDADTNHPQV